jgi:NADPH:quinone reductase-like Zn-dependent oxidoreductase
MKPAVCDPYGPPEVIQIKEVEKPAPSRKEVLVTVRAASINPLDGASMKKEAYTFAS